MYQENLQKSVNQYKTLKDKYDSEVSSQKFDTVVSSMSFDFLKARYIIETLSLFVESGPSYRMHFSNATQAMQLFLDIIDFKNQAQEILDNASYLESIIQLKDEINSLVDKSPYLSSAFSVPSFGRLENITKDCLNEIPRYNALKTKEFKWMFVESCIESLSHQELDFLLSKKLIQVSDLDKIAQTGSPKYEAGVRHLCEITGHTQSTLFTSKFSLKGVTFDGRQELLSNLRKELMDGKKPFVRAEFEMFTPENGKPEPSIPLYWNDSVIGFIPKEKAKEIAEKYPGSQLLAELSCVSGGGESPFGCEIVLSAVADKFKGQGDGEKDGMEK